MPGKRSGKHPEKALTAVKVRRLSKPGRYADGNGLYLVVDTSGSRRWILRTMVRGKRRDIGLGGVATVSLAQAREDAAKWRSVARAGGDPLSERRTQQRAVPTFEEAARKVHITHGATFRNERHKVQWLSSLENHVFPVFGDSRVDHIESADVLKALSGIWTTRPETARRVRQRIRTVMDWAKASGFRSGDNPVDGVAKVLPKQKGPPKHHKALPYAAVPGFLVDLRAAGSGTAVKLALEFLVLTAARTTEVLGARWGEVDLKGKVWTVPASRMKAGREHRVPLTPRCLEILEEAKSIADGGPFIFPGQSPKHPLSNMVFHMTLRRMKRTDCTPHGFRSSFRDWAEERTNHPRAVTEAALAHVVADRTEAAYRRTDLFEKRRKLMDQWAGFACKREGKVVRMRA